MKRSGMVITERDKNVFRYLFLHKLARISDLQIDVFGRKSRQAVQRRIQKLAHFRYLERTYLPGGERKLIYSLGQKALREWIGGKEALDRSQTKSSSPLHDLVLLEIARWLKGRSSVDAVFTENGIRSRAYGDLVEVEAIKPLNPDMALKLRFQGKAILLPLEYERMEKFSFRYEKIIRRYYQNKSAEAVLFVAENAAIRKKVSHLERKEKPPHKLFYTELDNLRTGNFQFQNIDGVTLKID